MISGALPNPQVPVLERFETSYLAALPSARALVEVQRPAIERWRSLRDARETAPRIVPQTNRWHRLHKSPTLMPQPLRKFQRSTNQDPVPGDQFRSIPNKLGQEAWLPTASEGQQIRVRHEVALPIPWPLRRFSKGITADRPPMQGAMDLRGRDWLQ
jgi:hypothetical protein